MSKNKYRQRADSRHERLPYCPTLGAHHMWWEDRHYNRGPERTLRNMGAFLLDRTIAQPPQHTLLHRSMIEPPKPSVEEAYDIIGVAKEYGLSGVLEQVDTRSTEHLRRQMAILAMPTDEAIERLTFRQYISSQELDYLEARV